MPRLKESDPTLSPATRVIVGGVLLLAVLWGSVPASSLATGPMCTLACCVGRAPHAAGSCMNGSCHAFLNRSRSHIHHEAVPRPSEQLCGLPRLTASLSRSGKTLASEPRLRASEGRSLKSASEPARLASATMGKPCALDCGAGTFSSTNQRRPREATLLLANRNRPPSIPGLARAWDTNPLLCEPRDTLASPRGPPKLFS